MIIIVQLYSSPKHNVEFTDKHFSSFRLSAPSSAVLLTAPLNPREGLFKVNILFLLLLFSVSDHMRLDAKAGATEVTGACKVQQVKAGETFSFSSI